jgi:purine-nucleoside phosphorylase
MEPDFEFFKKSAEYVKSKINFIPEIAIVLGTALGKLADEIENPVVIPYCEIPNFLVSTAPSHAGKLVLGTLSGKKVVCMSGRFHYYEGYSFEQLSAPVRLFKNLGVQKIILTNAAGAVNKAYKPGDVMIITDHINLMGASPTRGKNIPEFGSRFFDVSNMYARALRKIAIDCAKNSALSVHEGVYYFFCGPQFETPAEICAVRVLGADAVGMSTVTEALTAAHCGIPVLGLSLITNMAAGVLDKPVGGAEVEEMAHKVSVLFRAYVKEILSRI